jgi:uncharacterized protein involved in exopolysaccharide biosynthesis
MPQPRVLTLHDYVGMLRRRWYLAVFPAILGLMVGYGLARVLPKRYTSRSLMLIQQQQVPNSYVEPVITDDLNARIAHIEEETLSRTRLEPIIERYGLFNREAAHQTIDELVGRMQKLVTITPVEPVVQTRDSTVPGFDLSVTLNDPHLAQEVCNDLASMFVDEDIRERERSAQGTTSFLQSELADAKRKLDDQDAKLAAFERRYMGMLPDEAATNLSMLGTLNTQLDAVSQALNRAQQDKAYTESALGQQLQARKLMQQMKYGYVPVEGADPVQQQLGKLQAQLAMLEARYTPDYPDILSTKAEIARLKQQIAGAPDASGRNKKGKKPSSYTAEPPQVQQLRAQVNGDDETIKIDSREQEQVKNAIKVYEARLQLSPAIEEQYKKITRDHDTALKFYDSLLAKGEQSQMATELQRRQEGRTTERDGPCQSARQAVFSQASAICRPRVGWGAAGAFSSRRVPGEGTSLC